MSLFKMHKRVIAAIFCMAVIGGVGFASLVEMNSLPFWIMYASIGMALTFYLVYRLIWLVSHKKKILILICGGITFLFAIWLSPFLPKNSLFCEAVEGSVSITALGEKNEQSQSNEVWVTQILVDGNPIDMSEISLSEGWTRRDGGEIFASPENGKPTEPLVVDFYGKSVGIQTVYHGWSGKAAIQFSGENAVVLDLYKLNGSQRQYVWTSGNMWLFQVCTSVLIWLLGWTALVTLLCHSRLAYTVVCVVLWLTASEIKPTGSSYMAIGAISILAYAYAEKAKHSPDMQPYFSIKTRSALITVSLIASFCVFGYRLFLSGDYIDVSFCKFGYYLLGAVWVYPVIVACLYGFERYKERVLKKEIVRIENPAQKAWKVRLVATACFMCVMMLAWMSYYPGGYPGDAVSQFEQAENDFYNDWHPIIHTLIIKFILTICDNEAAVVLFQMMLLSILVGKVAGLAYECGFKERTIYISVIVFGLLPNQFTTNILPLKDYLYTYALLWLTLLFIELARNVECIKRVSCVIRISLAMFFTFALRHNGVVPYLFAVILLLVLAVKFRKRIRQYVCLSVALSMMLIGIYRIPVFSALNVTANSVTPYMTMFCAVGSCLNKGKLLSEHTMNKLEQVMPLEDWQEYYDRFLGHDRYMFEREGGMDLTDFSGAEAFSIYLEALVRYPDIVIKDRLDGTNLLWDVTMPDESFLAKTFDYVEVSSRSGIEIEGYEDGEVYINRSVLAELYRKLREFAFPGEREIDQITNVVLWRTGIYLLFMLVLVIFWQRNKLYRLWWAAMPLLGNTAGLMLVMYHQSYRYVFYVQWMTIVLALATYVMIRDKRLRDTNERRNEDG